MFLTDSKFYIMRQPNYLTFDLEPDVQLVNATALELMQYGYLMSEPLRRALEVSPRREHDCAALRDKFTAGQLNRPLFTNWEDRRGWTYGDLRVQILTYVFRINGNDLYDPNYMDQLLGQVDINDFITIELASDKDAVTYAKGLAGRATPLTGEERRNLSRLALALNLSDVRFKNDENKALVLTAVANEKFLAVALRGLGATARDVLRYAAARRDPEQVNLPNEVKYSNLTWQERKAMLRHINDLAQKNFEDVCEQMGLNRNSWARFAKHFKVFRQDKFKDYPYALSAFYASLGSRLDTVRPEAGKVLRNLIAGGVVEVVPTSQTLAYRTFASRVQSAINNRDFSEMMSLVGNRPGYLLRNLQTLSNAVSTKHVPEFLRYVSQALPKASFSHLLSLLRINPESSHRIIDANGLTTVQAANYPAWFSQLRVAVQGEVRRRFGLDGVVALEEGVENLVPPFASRNTEMARGAILPAENFPYMYFYMHWVQNGHRRTDLDHSYLCFDENWNAEMVYFGRQNNSYISQSGDILDAPAPNGATEYGQIRMDRIPKNIRYIVPVINVYSGDAFDKLPTSYAGFFGSDSASFRLNQATMRYDLKGNSQSNIPFVLDVWQRRVIVVDINTREYLGRTAYGSAGQAVDIIKAAISQNTVTVGELAALIENPLSANVSMTITKSRHDPENGVYAYNRLAEYFDPQ
jgi:stress response protein SCP2